MFFCDREELQDVLYLTTKVWLMQGRRGKENRSVNVQRPSQQ